MPKPRVIVISHESSSRSRLWDTNFKLENKPKSLNNFLDACSDSRTTNLSQYQIDLQPLLETTFLINPSWDILYFPFGDHIEASYNRLLNARLDGRIGRQKVVHIAVRDEITEGSVDCFLGRI